MCAAKKQSSTTLSNGSHDYQQSTMLLPSLTLHPPMASTAPMSENPGVRGPKQWIVSFGLTGMFSLSFLFSLLTSIWSCFRILTHHLPAACLTPSSSQALCCHCEPLLTGWQWVLFHRGDGGTNNAGSQDDRTITTMPVNTNADKWQILGTTNIGDKWVINKHHQGQ